MIQSLGDLGLTSQGHDTRKPEHKKSSEDVNYIDLLYTW